MPFETAASTAVIRRLRPAETALVSHLALASLWNVELAGRPLADVDALLRHVPSPSRALAEGGAYFVVEIAGVAAAGGGWSLMPVSGLWPHDRQPVLAPLFFIDPDEARRGLRARLLDRIEGDIAAAGHAHVHAVVPLGSAHAYRSSGYRPSSAMEPSLSRLPVLRLRKRLAAELAAVA